jgi:hypothetical protein
MAATPEGKVKTIVKQVLKANAAYYHMPVQNGMGSPSLDFACCVPVLITEDMVGKTIGAYLGIETKREGGKVTPRQERTMKEIRDAGGRAILIEGEEEAREFAAWRHVAGWRFPDGE